MIGPNGLLFIFDWMIGGPWWATLIWFLVLTPILPMVIALVFESRTLPWSWKTQFLTFSVGDIFLAIFAAAIVSYMRESTIRPVDLVWHLLVLAGSITAAWWITRGEMKAAKAKAPFAYTVRAVNSPTKIYHNYVLYGGYGYILVMLVINVGLQAAMNSYYTPWLIAAFVPLVVWISLLFLEDKLLKLLTRKSYLSPKRVKQLRANHAHIDSWQPIWK